MVNPYYVQYANRTLSFGKAEKTMTEVSDLGIFQKLTERTHPCYEHIAMF